MQSDSDQITDDPLGVRRAARRVVALAERVRIDDAALDAVAGRLAQHGAFAVPAWNTRYHFADGTPRTANYVLLLDTLNFSFWGEPRWRIDYQGETLDGYWALAAALKRAVEAGEPILEARVWAAMTRQRLAQLLAGEGEIPLLAERVEAVREAGAWLLRRWDGEFERAVREGAGCRAPIVAGLLATSLRSFADIAAYQDEPVPLLKRAQICAGDLFGAFGGQPPYDFPDMAALTAFADYKLPQILRAFGILVYEPALAARIDGREELPAGSPEEVEIRAATVEAVERLMAAFARRGRNVAAYQLDWYLWEAAQAAPATARPYHRTRTIFY